MKRLFAALILLGAACFGADFAGNWTGKADLSVNGERRTVPVYMALKQDGATVTGTAGQGKYEQNEIRNGKVDGDTVTFQLQPEEDAPLMTVRLTMKEGRLVGTVKGENADNEVHATLELEREK